MEKHEQIELLRTLAQVDIDAVHSYNHALDEITDGIIRSRLEEFRDTHQQHVADLSDTIRDLGGKAPDMSPDFKGYAIEAFTVLRKVTGMKGALKALKTTEEISNRYYRRAIPEELPAEIKDQLRRNLSNVRNQLEYIENNLQAMAF